MVFLASGLTWLIQGWPTTLTLSTSRSLVFSVEVGHQETGYLSAFLIEEAPEASPDPEGGLSLPGCWVGEVEEEKVAETEDEPDSEEQKRLNRLAVAFLSKPEALPTPSEVREAQGECGTLGPILRRYRELGPELDGYPQDDIPREWKAPDFLLARPSDIPEEGLSFDEMSYLVCRPDYIDTETETDFLPAVLPGELRERTVVSAHLRNSHQWSEQTFLKLRSYFWWPRMQEDIARMLNNCHTCAIARARRSWKSSTYTTMKVTAPHQVYGIDVWYATVVSAEGYAYILTVVDFFHGYVRFYPLRTKSAEEIMSVLHNYVFSHFGLPTGFMFSDDDPAFTSRLVQEYLRITQLKWVKTAPHSQWENGRVERRHQMLNLCLLILKDKSEWPSQLPGAAAHALNSLVSSVTGVSASEVEYGRVPRSPFDHARIDATQDFEQEMEDLDTHREERIAHQ